MTITIFVPCDSSALSVGAEDVAEAICAEGDLRGIDIQIVRNGSRGMCWLEPLVEVLHDGVRHAYGPVTVADVPGLFDSRFQHAGGHDLALGPTDALDWLANQERLTFARVGVTDPLSLADYEAHGGLVGLRRAIAMSRMEIVAEVTDSGLRGRGGAGFPTGIKWKTVSELPDGQKYICCNADEGDSGTFADRMLMEGDPFCLLEGMVIAGLAVGASEGYVYIRSEYPHAIATMKQAIRLWEEAGLLGLDVAGSGQPFQIKVRRGAGAY
ncbi:MAG: formate dehydrogenase, partial [Alphaproteobacteria bacterium]|nr:formate dehydrogenase [Alphaproteobacteria bacterium]